MVRTRENKVVSGERYVTVRAVVGKKGWRDVVEDGVIIECFSLQATVKGGVVCWEGGVGRGVYSSCVSVVGKYGTEGGIKGRERVFSGGRVAPGVGP